MKWEKVLLIASCGVLAVGLAMAYRRAEEDRARERTAGLARLAAEASARARAAQVRVEESVDEDELRHRMEREFSERALAIWKRYDAEPENKKTKARLKVAADEATDLALMSHSLIRASATQSVLISFRKRMAPLVRPESYATGHELRTLVPSNNTAQCLVWGSMWANESAEDLKSVGFVRLFCPSENREWKL